MYLYTDKSFAAALNAGLKLLLPALLLCARPCAAAGAPDVRKELGFVVRRADQARAIAQRFHIRYRELARHNPGMHRGQLQYSGKQITIPVWLRPRNAASKPADFNLADYMPDADSLDPYVREDFICMADLQADTLRKLAIERELRKTDRSIAQMRNRLDSIEAANMKDLSNRELKKMQMARERHTGNFTIASMIDSALLQRKKLCDERSKIDLRLADYENLIDNAAYNAAHRQQAPPAAIHLADWGDDPAKQSNSNPKNKKTG